MTGFWEQHKTEEYSGLPGFLTPEELDELIDTARTVEIEAVREDEGKFGRKFVVDLRIGAEVRSKSFTQGSITNRDLFLADVMTHLDDNGTPVPVILERWGAGVGFAAPPPATEDTPWPSDPEGDDGAVA